jgi:acetyltransferase-like isoleucine patch superfamily enzyme
MATLRKVIYRAKGFLLTKSFANKRIRVVGRLPKIRSGSQIDFQPGITFVNRLGHTRLSTEKNGRISIGRNVFLNESCIIHSVSSVKIGDNTKIGENVQILDTAFHPVGSTDFVETAPITLEDNVWIANNVVILKGVTIGQHSVVGIGSVVTKSFPAHSLIVGNPAFLKKSLD